MHYRYVTVPKSKAAESRLFSADLPPQDTEEIKIPEDLFYLLHNAGIFDGLNERCSAWIQDYEEAEITSRESLHAGAEYLHNLLREMESGRKTAETDSSVSEQTLIIRRMQKLFEKAVEYGTGVYFFF